MAPIADHDWKTVAPRKSNQKQKPADGGVSGNIRRISITKMVSADVKDEWNGAVASSSKRGSYSYSIGENAAGKENLKAEKAKKPQPKKEDLKAEKSKKLQPKKEDLKADKSKKLQPKKEDLNADKSKKLQPKKEDLKADKSKKLQPKKEDLKAEKPQPKEEDLKAEKPQPKEEKNSSLFEAMAKIDHSGLKAFLVVSSELYSDEPLTQILRYMDYISIPEVEFSWLKMFPLEGTWPKLIDVIDVPLCDIPRPFFDASIDWIDQLPVRIVAGFIAWAFGCTIIHLIELAKSCEQPTSSKHLMPIFVTLTMLLRLRPEALVGALPALRERPYFQEKNSRLPLTVWMMAVASKGNLGVALYSWAHNLLPIVGDTSCNPQSRDLILHLVEHIVAHKMAWTMRRNQAEGVVERMISPPLFEILLRLTFPASSARVEDTKRFEAVYPSLKEVALTGAPGSEAMKQVIQQIFTLSFKLAGEEGNPALAKEATSIAIWSLTQNVDCLKHWDSLYTENIEASVALLKKLVDEWKDQSLKLLSSEITLTQTVKSFRLKNEKAITKGGSNASLHKEADESCKFISQRLAYGRYKHYCLRAAVLFLAIAGAAATAVVVFVAGVTAFLYFFLW